MVAKMVSEAGRKAHDHATHVISGLAVGNADEYTSRL